MSDRRNRPLIRCQVRGCPHVGPWDSARPVCPQHLPDLRADARAAIERARPTTPTEPRDPVEAASTLLGAPQTPPRPARRNPQKEERQ